MSATSPLWLQEYLRTGIWTRQFVVYCHPEPLFYCLGASPSLPSPPPPQADDEFFN